MDAIQLALDVHLKRTTQNSQRFFFKQQELSEATYPLLISYLEWLRKINAALNKFDVMHQNEQKKHEFKFLFKHNLLFFLTATRQFNVINQLFKESSPNPRLHHLLALIRKKHHKARQKKRKRLLMVKFKEKTRGYVLDQRKTNAHHLSHIHFEKKIVHYSSDNHNNRKIKNMCFKYTVKIDYLRNILTAIQRNTHMKSLIKKALLHQLTLIHQRALKNKETLHFITSLNQDGDQIPSCFAFLSEVWKQLHKDVLDINSIFNQCKSLIPELTGISNEEITASKELENELGKLMHEHYELENELYAEKVDDVLTEDIDTHLSSEHSVDAKKSSFFNQRLTFFSTSLQHRNDQTIQLCSETTHKLRVGN
ncbi:Uncharacterised protein [Legionella steigerwaltii]|uniref:Uncharacterized protein n=1 Tax=Legionella steigerwaltii TaxID=460 RepID=A0A378L5N9_9GAMM|nr:hypothetical protein [Legionella steigerwaltii]KTD77348.1 hypothetical protein Lstg_1705 [Legionella steigerwaltii]STY22074.1 Uncharacterised protein [Legionella steigerwaltii]